MPTETRAMTQLDWRPTPALGLPGLTEATHDGWRLYAMPGWYACGPIGCSNKRREKPSCRQPEPLLVEQRHCEILYAAERYGAERLP